MMEVLKLLRLKYNWVVGAVVKGKVGRRGAFEVKVQDQLIHSKLQTGGFPDRNEVVEIIQDVVAGSEPRKVIRSAKTCLIL